MARYAIGDVQGCFYSFAALLKQIQFNPKQDKLYLTGDLINRGRHSLLMLRWCHEHQSSLCTILGNHDLHALAVAYGIKTAHRHDTLEEILTHTQCHTWLDWLRQQPLIHQAPDFVMVHAGLLPQWSIAQACALASEVQQALASEQYTAFLQQMYGNTPNAWHDGLAGAERLRVITNGFTRLRICNAQGEMEFAFKGELKDIPEGYYPWFKVPKRVQHNLPILFGHWSALGLYMNDGVIGLDTGCLWGRSLTAYCLETSQLFHVPLDARDAPRH